LTVKKKTLNALGVLVGREVEMFLSWCVKLDGQCTVPETDRKSVPSRRSSMTERTSSVCRQSNSWNVKLASGHGGQIV